MLANYTTRVIAHCDVNNFYANCERVFRPDWRGKPIFVLSNNDGCGIAMSLEAKALGLKMGDPYFKVKDFCKQHDVIVCSSNYALYGELSDRFMRITGSFAPVQEVYSCDETFLDFTGLSGNHRERGQAIRARVLQWIGLPICVGISTSKTLAKLADFVAKKRPVYEGVCNFNDFTPQALDELLATIPMDEVWGVGRRLAPQLEALRIHTVLDLKRADPEYMRQQFTVVMEKTVRELNGVACMELEEVPPAKQQIMSSRSFGYRVTDLPSLVESVSLYMSRAAEKLRMQQSYTSSIQVYIATGAHGDDERYSNVKTVPLPAPTANTLQLVNAAVWALKQIYKPGYRYLKSGVALNDIVPAQGQQGDLYGYQPNDDKSERLMRVMDEINQKMGKYTLRVALQGFNEPWAMKQEFLTPNYLSDINDLVTVY